MHLQILFAAWWKLAKVKWNKISKNIRVQRKFFFLPFSNVLIFKMTMPTRWISKCYLCGFEMIWKCDLHQISWWLYAVSTNWKVQLHGQSNMRAASSTLDKQSPLCLAHKSWHKVVYMRQGVSYLGYLSGVQCLSGVLCFPTEESCFFQLGRSQLTGS